MLHILFELGVATTISATSLETVYRFNFRMLKE